MRSSGWTWLTVALLTLRAGIVLADTTWTGGGDGTSWSDAANWGGTPPAGQRRVFINGTSSVNIGASVNDTFNRLLLADGGDADDVNVHMTGGSLTITGSADSANLEIASIGNAHFRLSGGTVTVANRVRIAVDPPPATPQGTLTIDGGSMTVNNRLFVGFGESSVGTMNMVSGTLTAFQIFVPDGVNAAGTLMMTGGTINTQALWVPTNLDAVGSTGHVQLNGGVINANDFRLTNSAELNITGTMDVRGGMLVVDGDARPLLNGYVTSGVLTGYGFADTAHVLIEYNAVANRTEVTAVADASCFIQPPTLPQGAVGAAYSASLQAAAGCSGVEWAVTAGRLPDGLSLNPVTGQISGTPEVSGTFEFTVTMSADEANRSLALSLAVAGGALTEVVRSTDVWIRELTPNQVAYEHDRIRIYSPAVGPDAARRWGLVEFDISSLAGATIQGARLKLYQAESEGTPMRQSAWVIPSQPPILTTTWNGYMASQHGARQTFEQFGRFVLGPSTPASMYYASRPATAADVALIQAEANGDGKLTLVLAPDEDGEYIRNWGDGVFSGEPPLLEIDVGSSCIIKTLALPPAVQGMSYSAVLETSAGCNAGAWDISGCYLPPGLSLNPATGAIGGLPVYRGQFGFTARFTPAAGTPREVELSIDVQTSPADLDNDGDVDATDAATFQANFTGPAAASACTPDANAESAIQSSAETWVRPSDPNGVYEQDNVQVRSGAASNVRIGLVEFDISNLAGQSIQSARLRMHPGIVENLSIRASTFLIPSGIANATYNTYLAEKDAAKLPFGQFGRFDINSPSLLIEDSAFASEADLQMIMNEANGDGLLTLVLFADEDGVPYARKWGDGDIGEKPELIVTVGPACHIRALPLPAAVAGTPYSATLQASDACSGSLQWQVSQCALPPGLTLNASTGLISGTPKLAGSFPFQVQMTAAQGVRTHTFSIDVGMGAPGDFDEDGDVDLVDFDIFALSFTGVVGTRPFCGSAEFTSTDTPKNIPDGGSVSSVISVPPGATIGDLNVFVDITHPAEVDVRITLTSPSNQTIVLKNFTGDVVSFMARTYDDEGVQPAQPLSTFDGQNAAGDWTLTVSDFDTAFMDFGVLNSWKLIVTGQ